MVKLNIQMRSIDSLRPYKRNARTHSKAQIKQIAVSIEKFGFTNPVLIDADGQIIAGHGRVEAVRLLGWTSVPTISLEHLTPDHVRAYIIADNKLAENAGWDHEILATEFQFLSELDLDFDLSITGFEMPEIDLMIQGIGSDNVTDGDETSFNGPDRSRPPVTAPGDLWILGDHKVYCGDALKIQSYDALMGPELAQMVFTDPPFNVPIDRNVTGKGKFRHDEFLMASGEMDRPQFTAFLTEAMERMYDCCVEGALHYICMDWRHHLEIGIAGASAYPACLNICVWNKTNAGMGSLYRSQHEWVFVFKCGTAPHINNIELGRHGRNRTNVWTYAGANGFTASRDRDLKMHPTVKPLALVMDAILDASHRGGIILDPFGGSGTTLIAAERTGRKARLIELDPHYVDTIVRRFEVETGIEAYEARSGLAFKTLA